MGVTHSQVGCEILQPARDPPRITRPQYVSSPTHSMNLQCCSLVENWSRYSVIRQAYQIVQSLLW